MAGSSAGRIDLDLELNSRPFQRQLNGIAGMANGLVGGAFKGLGGVIAGAFAIGGLVQFGKTAIGLASDLQEVQNVVDVTFRAMSQDINNWSTGLIEGFGLSELSGKKYASTMGAMLKSSGLTGVQMEGMSKNLTELSADMASFYNLSNQMSFEKVFSGMTGETEPLKALGINMSVANMEAYALSQGITTSYQKMDQASQSLLRYNYLMSITKDAQGDFARTSNSWANQVKIMGEQWRIFQGNMGAGFINILTPVLRGLNWLIAKLQVAAAYFKAFTELIFGNAVGGGTAAATGAITDVGDAAAGAGGSLGDMGEAADKTGKAAKKAGKNVKGSLAGFDQLNTLAKSTADSLDDAAGAGAGAAGLGAGMAGLGDLDLGTPDINVDPIKQRVADLITGIKSSFAGAWSYIAAGWAGMRPALQPFADMLVPISKSIIGIGDTFNDLKNKVLVPLAKYTLGNFIPQLVIGFTKSFAPVIANQITWAFAEFDKTFRHSTDEAARLWTTVWLPNLETVKNAFLIAMPVIAGALDGLLTGAINPFMDFMLNEFMIPLSSSMTETLVPLFSGTLAWAVLEFAKTSQTAVAAIVDLWSGTFLPALTDIRDAFLDVIPEIGGAWQSLLDESIKPFVDYVLSDFIIPISAALLDTLVPILSDTVVWAIKEVASAFKWAVDLINDIYKTVFKPVFELIKQIVLDTLKIIKDAWDKHGVAILSGLTGVLDNIKKIVQRLWDDVLKPIIIPFLDKLKELWEGTFKSIAVQMANFVLNLIELGTTIFNKFISPLVNKIIDVLAPAFVKGFNIALNIVTEVIKSIGGLIKGVMETLNGLITFLTGVFTGNWSKAWEGVKGIFKGVFDSLWSIAKLPLNMIIDAINGIIDGFNSISISVPEIDVFGKKMGGGSIGLPHIPTIPRLAKGGLAYGPTLAMVGDNRGAAADPEVVSPLSTLQGMLESSNQQMVTVLLQILDALRSGNQTAIFKLGETELGRAAIRSINTVQRQAGGVLLEL
jgi:phage-related protein